MGRGDPLETAGLMVMAAHLLPVDALHTVSGASRRAITGEAAGIVAGAPAELVAVAATEVRDALAFGPSGRLVIHRGRVVSGARSTSPA